MSIIQTTCSPTKYFFGAEEFKIVKTQVAFPSHLDECPYALAPEDEESWACTYTWPLTSNNCYKEDASCGFTRHAL